MLDLFLEVINKFILLDLFSIQIWHRVQCQRHGDFTWLMSMGHGFGLLLLSSQLWWLSAPVLLWHKQLRKITASTHNWRTGIQSFCQQRTGMSWHNCAEAHKKKTLPTALWYVDTTSLLLLYLIPVSKRHGIILLLFCFFGSAYLWFCFVQFYFSECFVSFKLLMQMV